MPLLAKTMRFNRWAARALFSLRGTAVRRASRRKILYLHVAKAGGSSFNSILYRHFRGEAHCEQYIETNPAPEGGRLQRLGNVEYLSGLEFISGHLTLPLLARSGLDLQEYMLVTILRHPFAQTVSHMNWMIKISEDEEGPLYKSVPPGVQRISRELRTVGDWSPASVIHWLERFPGWFKNNQSRYFVPADRLDVDTITQALDRMALVGVTERLEAFVDRFADMTGLPPGRDRNPVPHENRNDAYHVPLGVLDDPQLREFLAGYNQFDMAMYTYAERTLAP